MFPKYSDNRKRTKFHFKKLESVAGLYITNCFTELDGLFLKPELKQENEPSVINNILMKKASAKYKKAANTIERKSWHEKTTNLNFKRDGEKL